tara:strand:+ start:398 stop:826 length:429 start_codon:yes stop_codon:yes gene_type:complete
MTNDRETQRIWEAYTNINESTDRKSGSGHRGNPYTRLDVEADQRLADIVYNFPKQRESGILSGRTRFLTMFGVQSSMDGIRVTVSIECKPHFDRRTGFFSIVVTPEEYDALRDATSAIQSMDYNNSEQEQTALRIVAGSLLK